MVRPCQQSNHWQSAQAHWIYAKKKTYGYRERNEAERAAFLEQLKAYSYDEVVYVDEAGVDDTEDYPYGWNEQGERFYALKLGHRTRRISMIAGWCEGEVLAPMTFEGTCNTALVEAWAQRFLVVDLKPGQLVVMDNASFHQSSTLRALIEKAGCHLLFLPTYSPDLNKIEKFWARLKNYLRQNLRRFENVWDAVDNAFRALS